MSKLHIQNQKKKSYKHTLFHKLHLLLMLLIREGAVSQVASLFYLVPVATAVESYFLFGESLTPVQIGGMVLVISAVLTIRKKPARS